MQFAITLRLDPISAVPIEAMWRRLAADGIDADRLQLGYAPHITLAIYPDVNWAPITGFLDRADLASFRPVEVLQSLACGRSDHNSGVSHRSQILDG
jgi:hypothetical protein